MHKKSKKLGRIHQKSRHAQKSPKNLGAFIKNIPLAPRQKTWIPLAVCMTPRLYEPLFSHFAFSHKTFLTMSCSKMYNRACGWQVASIISVDGPRALVNWATERMPLKDYQKYHKRYGAKFGSKVRRADGTYTVMVSFRPTWEPIHVIAEDPTVDAMIASYIEEECRREEKFSWSPVVVESFPIAPAVLRVREEENPAARVVAAIKEAKARLEEEEEDDDETEMDEATDDEIDSFESLYDGLYLPYMIPRLEGKDRAGYERRIPNISLSPCAIGAADAILFIAASKLLGAGYYEPSDFFTTTDGKAVDLIARSVSSMIEIIRSWASISRTEIEQKDIQHLISDATLAVHKVVSHALHTALTVDPAMSVRVRRHIISVAITAKAGSMFIVYRGQHLKAVRYNQSTRPGSALVHFLAFLRSYGIVFT